MRPNQPNLTLRQPILSHSHWYHLQVPHNRLPSKPTTRRNQIGKHYQIHQSPSRHNPSTTHNRQGQRIPFTRSLPYLHRAWPPSYSLPYTPQQNGIAERINSTLVSAARAALHHSRLPLFHWEDAIRDAAFKYNCTMHNATKQLPCTLWFGEAPRNARFFIFGQLGTIPHLTDRSTIPKLHTRSHSARYLYPLDETHVMTLNLDTNKPQRIRSVDFTPYFRNQDPTATSIAAFKSFTYHPVPLTISPTTPPPLNHQQAQKYPDAHLWSIAHNHELDLLDKNNVIRWIPKSQLPTKTKLIPLQVTYRYKRDQEGNIEKYKARCVLRGDKMLPNIHYDPDKTTTYMADRISVRLLFAIAAAYSLEVEHFDIESAYLHEKFKHSNTGYVRQPPRFDGSMKYPNHVGILLGNLYGGKQAANIYLSEASKFLSQHNFQQATADPCLFYRITNDGVTSTSVSMDDFLVSATSTKHISLFFQELTKKYLAKRLGTPSNFLGWKVERLPNGGFHISQPAAMEAVLAKTGLTNANGTRTPYLDNAKLHLPNQSEKNKLIKLKLYQPIVGELRYIADSTRPDAFFLVNRLSAAASCPTKRHWAALKRLLRYFRATTSHGIFFPALRETNSLRTFIASDPNRTSLDSKTHNLLVSYSDADYAADPTDLRSISGIIHLYNNAPIHWYSTKQSIHALSTCEAEYIAATTASQQTIWLRRLLEDLKMLSQLPTTLYIDNTSAIKVEKNTGPTKRRKFIDLRHHYLHGHIAKKRITIKHIPSREMLDDMLTKLLRPDPFNTSMQKLNVLSHDEASAKHPPTTKSHSTITKSAHNDLPAPDMPLTRQGDCDNTQITKQTSRRSTSSAQE